MKSALKVLLVFIFITNIAASSDPAVETISKVAADFKQDLIREHSAESVKIVVKKIRGLDALDVREYIEDGAYSGGTSFIADKIKFCDGRDCRIFHMKAVITTPIGLEFTFVRVLLLHKRNDSIPDVLDFFVETGLLANPRTVDSEGWGELFSI
ncbi:hypothetical protein [Halobacteriovorax sp. JY17]|uniref:hypothetical protein n=1 Tax=Halobacteriovorax sp. JY17 TaxID=2014617 RepID=UPI000C37BCBF|nr:hypothetical protein [Halobacteriovorax sp. JY17]PIK14582.1 MAG: hypothetical protein CES88_09590 [Halobacteriovorax sp. JY17]